MNAGYKKLLDEETVARLRCQLEEEFEKDLIGTSAVLLAIIAEYVWNSGDANDPKVAEDSFLLLDIFTNLLGIAEVDLSEGDEPPPEGVRH